MYTSKTKASQKIFYCYALCDSSKPNRGNKYSYNYKTRFDFEPFYIGYGHNARSDTHMRKAFHKKNGTYTDNSHKSLKIRKIIRDGHKILIVKTNLGTQAQALKREIELIALIGRKGQNKGPLINHTDGGDGTLGRKHTYKTKIKMSASRLGHYVSEATKIKLSLSNKGQKRSKETCLNISLALKGKTQSEESNKKRSETLKGRRKGVSWSEKHIASFKANPAMYKKSEITKEKISNSLKGIPSLKKGIPLTKQHKKNLSAALIGKSKGFTGKHSKESRLKMSKTRTGTSWSKARRDSYNLKINRKE